MLVSLIMAPQGSGSALVPSLLLCILALSCTTIAHAKQYTVGDASGWELSVDYSAWAAKYKFAVGDTLLFTYSSEQHNVYQVSEADYNACDTTKPTKMWADGSTVVTLADATTYYFICGILGHCTGGMKVAVAATGGGATPPTAAPPAKAPASTPPAKAPTAKAPVSTPPAKAPTAKAPTAKAPTAKAPTAKAPVSKTPSPSPSTTPSPSPSVPPTPTPSPSSSPSSAPTPSSPSSSPASSPPSPPSPAAAPSNSSTPPSSSHALASPQFLLFTAILGSLLLPLC